MTNLDLLAAEAHANAVAHGFYDDPDPDRLFALMHAELSEAIQEERSGTPMAEIVRDWDDEPLGHAGIAVELADYVLRLLDYAAYRGFAFAGPTPNVPTYEELPRLVNALHDLTCDLCRAALVLGGQGMQKAWNTTELWIIRASIEHVRAFLEVKGVDLWEVVREKMEYNTTRPYMHGKLY